jgi:pyridoxamine--pyruvate transaminase
MRYLDDAAPVITLTSGPVNAYPDVLRGLGRTVLYDYDPAFQIFYEKVVEKAQKAMRLSTRPVILHGEPVLGLEAAAASLITPNDTVLNLASGVYGKGFGYWAKRYAPNLLEIETPYNEAIDPQAVRDMLARHPEVTVVSVCHHDTPSGTINPIDEIGALVAGHGAYLIVDAVSSFGGMKTHPEECRADIYITGPNKCLGAPPGLTMAGISNRAWAKMKANPSAPRASMLSILDWETAWSRAEPFPFTPSVAEMNGLDVALDLYLDEGPEAVWGTACADREGHAGRRPLDGSRPVGGARGDRLADDHSDPDARRRRRGAVAARGARPLRRRLLVGSRRDARQADPHRSYGPHRSADLCRCRARGPWRCTQRAGFQNRPGCGCRSRHSRD